MSEDRPGGAHYGGANNPYEPIKIIHALGWGEGFNRGNALKYLMRAGSKGGPDGELMDLKKAGQYIKFELQRIEAARIPNVPGVECDPSNVGPPTLINGPMPGIYDHTADPLAQDLLAASALAEAELEPAVPDLPGVAKPPERAMGKPPTMWEALQRPVEDKDAGVTDDSTGS